LNCDHPVLSTVSEAELKRLKDVFKRSSTLSGYMTQNVFIKEVLGDGVPPRLAEVQKLIYFYLELNNKTFPVSA